MSENDHIALLDIGKSNAKLIVIESGTGSVVHRVETAVTSVEGPICRQLNVVDIERWLLNALANAPEKHLIEAIVPVAHGAAAVLLGSNQEVLCAPDYEDARFDSVADAYRPLRDPFAVTLSPWLPFGLNLGRQLFYIQTTATAMFQSARHIVPYAQFWSQKLCGVLASEVTSLGCHTDLWLPKSAEFSTLAKRQGWADLFAPIEPASRTLGSISKEVIAATDLDPTCRVLCGLHDSNASLLGHTLGSDVANLTVVSSGTWTVIMSRRGRLDRLHEDHDMLANVDVHGEPIATARFMGGREYDSIVAGSRAVPTEAALNSVLRQQAMALPSFAEAGGPFRGRRGRYMNAANLSAEERAALATLYVALMTDLSLEQLGHANSTTESIVVDGPFAGNPLYPALLAALHDRTAVYVGDERYAALRAAHYLATGSPLMTETAEQVTPVDIPSLRAYRDHWRRLLDQPMTKLAS